MIKDDDRVDQNGWMVMTSWRQWGLENWRSLYVVEITLHSMRSRTSSRCKDCKDDLEATMTKRTREFWMCWRQV